MTEQIHQNVGEFPALIIPFLTENYWSKMWDFLEAKPELKASFTTFLLNPEKLIFYFGKTHWAIEYVGTPNNRIINSNHELKVEVKDYRNAEYFLDEIIGIDFAGMGSFRIPLSGYHEDLFVPTNEALDILKDNGWNFAGESMIMSFNSGGFTVPENSISRIVNSFFYNTDSNGLIARNIKWLDILPLEIIDIDEDTESYNFGFWKNIEERIILDSGFKYPLPEGFQYEKLAQLNRFVELISSENTLETDITRFLSAVENQFLLKMAFFGSEVHSEKECDWQTESERKSIRPDFFITEPDGNSNIIEFKLPFLKANAVVGQANRETFNSQINSYIQQTNVYEEYFEDPNNRTYVKEKHGLDVRYPKRILVVGRRWMFDSHDWRRIQRDYRNITIRTFDDLIDGILAQLYS